MIVSRQLKSRTLRALASSASTAWRAHCNARFGSCQLRRASTAQVAAEEMERKYLVPTYNSSGVRAKEGLVFESGSGSYLVDESGRRYLDFSAGIAVNALGHSDPKWIDAVTSQLHKVTHTSNLYHTRPALDLAKELVDRSGFDRVFFCNSGTEANEAALKFSRKYQLRRLQNQSKVPTKVDFACQKGKDSVECRTEGGTCDCWPQASKLQGGFRHGTVAFQSGFHGRTGFALSVTHKPAIRQPFAPMIPDCTFLPYNDAEAAKRIGDVAPSTVIVEPHAGEGGVIAGTPAFLETVEEQAKKADAVLIADEVQCGLGRLGKLFAHEAYGMQPDIMTLAKPLAGGLPIGAVLVKEHIANAIDPGDHGTTFGGNPLVCAAALHVLKRIDTPEFLGHVRTIGKAIKGKALDIQKRFPHVVSEVRAPVTGGPFVGLQLSVSPAPLVQQCVEDGLLIITAGTSTVRLCPPLTMSMEEAMAGMNMLERAMETVFGQGK